MTNPNVRPPRLYVTNELIENARDESVTGIVPNGSSIKTVTERGSEGALRGIPVRQLVLHTSNDVSERGLKVFRLTPHEAEATHLEATNRPGIHPEDLIEQGLPELHTLVVPIKDFDELSAAWALHHSARSYGQSMQQAGGAQELRPPTELFGAPGVDGAFKAGALFLGKIISQAQPASRRETAESLADQLLDGMSPIIGRGTDAIRAVQGTPDQAPLPLMRPDEMAALVEQAAPLEFRQGQ